MSVLLYNIFLLLFRAGIHIASLFNQKALKWVAGRKGIFENLRAAIPPGEKIIWVHCASLGEFEQGRPIIERIKASAFANLSDEALAKPETTVDKQGTSMPSEALAKEGYKILLTFFSPSGYEVQKNYKEADWVFYLPLDGPRTAKRFLEIVHPSLVIFVKYEFWYYYLKKIKYRGIPLILVSAFFRKDMSFFRWYGGLQRKMLSRFDHLFVQNDSSKKLLEEFGITGNTSVAGDTRFDRVAAIADRFEPILLIEKFIGTKKTIVAGSTWKEDEDLMKDTLPFLTSADLKLIIAPHEISEKNLASIKGSFPDALLYSELENEPGAELGQCLIIDNIGMLSRLYKYAWCCYVGGGFTKSGIHNVLEAAVYGKPVIFGPNYKKYHEAVELVTANGAFSTANKEELTAILKRFIVEPVSYQNTAEYAGEFVRSHTGATQKILGYIQEKRLLTS